MRKSIAMLKTKPRKLTVESLELRRVLAVLHPDAPTLPGDLAPCVAQIGDSNVDGYFDEADLTHVMQAGKYETGQSASFQDGDWNGDGVFDTRDFVDALRSGTYREHQEEAQLTCRTFTWEKTLDPFAPGAVWKGVGTTDAGEEVQVSAYDFLIGEDGLTIDSLTFDISHAGGATVSLPLAGVFAPGADSGSGSISLTGPGDASLNSITNDGVVSTSGDVAYTNQAGERVTVTYQKTLDIMNPQAVWKGTGQSDQNEPVVVRAFDFVLADGLTVEAATFEIADPHGHTVMLDMIGSFTPGTEAGTGSISLIGTHGSALHSTTSNGLVTTMGSISYIDEEHDSHEHVHDIGAAALLTPETVLEAAKLIKTGETYSLAHVLEHDSPTNAFVNHEVDLDLIVGPLGTNELVALAETIHSNFMHVGTQFDALGHIGIGTEYFNGHTFDELAGEHGLNSLGADEVPPFFTRGVLLDVAKYKGMEILPPTYEITVEDLEGTLELQGTEIRQGDVVIFHTGWGTHFTSDPVLFATTQPGIGVEVAQALASKDVVMVGADNVFVEVFPNPDENLVLPVHQELLTKSGIYLMEVVKTDDLARDEVYEFAFVFSAIRAAGATGSAAHPFAII